MTTESDTAGLSTTCHACGGENRSGARFCRQCGAALVAPPTGAKAAPPPVADVSPARFDDRPSPAGVGAPLPRPSAPPPPGTAPGRPRALDWRVLVPAGAGLVLVLGLVGYGVLADPFNLFAPTVKAYANQEVVVVNDRRMAAATKLGAFHRSDSVKGKWTDRRLGHFRWLEVEWPGAKHAYIWGSAVSLKRPPELDTKDAGSIPAPRGLQVSAEPDESSTPIDSLVAGEAAVVVGSTSGGWTEILLPAGGVGYVKRDALFGPSESSSPLPGITHYTCTVPHTEGANSADTPNLSFVFDDNRRCMDHRYTYLADEAGGLSRIKFNDKNHSASLLYFSADRRRFQRTDIQLDPKAYKRFSKHENELASLACAPPGDPSAAAALSESIGKLMPDFAAQTTSASSMKREWTCKSDDDKPADTTPRPAEARHGGVLKLR